MRDVESNEELRKLVVYKGQGSGGRPIRFLTKQSRATRGGPFEGLRLCAWFYIRRQDAKDVVNALDCLNRKGKQKQGRFGPLQQAQLKEHMKDDPIYHVVVRGKDPILTPAFAMEEAKAKDIVTNYFITGMGELVRTIQEHLDELFDPLDGGVTPLETFHLLVENSGFVGLLEEYWRLGDISETRNLKLAGRLEGSNCLLHKAIKENFVELVEELVTHFVAEVVDKPWLELAEPFWQHGKYRLSAFHRAVYDGRPECLRVLLQYAKKYGRLQELAKLKNWEDKEYQSNYGRDGRTIIEMAEEKKNFACMNVLADFFPQVKRNDCGRDAESREFAFVDLLKPRVEISLSSRARDTKVETFLLGERCTMWSELFAMVGNFVQQAIKGYRTGTPEAEPACDIACDPVYVGVNIHHASLVGMVPSEDECIGMLESLAATSSWRSDPLDTCVYRLGRLRFYASRVQESRSTTVLRWMRALMRCNIAQHGAFRADLGILPWNRRTGAWTGDASVGHGDVQVEGKVDDEAARELNITEAAGVLRDYYTSLVHEGSVKVCDVDLWTAAKLIGPERFPRTFIWLIAGANAFPFPERFLSKMLRTRGMDEHDKAREFSRTMEGCNCALSIHALFWDDARLIFDKPENPADNLEVEAVLYVGVVIEAWFRSFPELPAADCSARDARWRRYWADRLAAFAALDQELLLSDEAFLTAVALLTVNLDKVLSVYIRMDGVLDYAYQKVRSSPDSFQHHIGAGSIMAAIQKYPDFVKFIRARVPAEAVKNYLPLTAKAFREVEQSYR